MVIEQRTNRSQKIREENMREKQYLKRYSIDKAGLGDAIQATGATFSSFSASLIRYTQAIENIFERDHFTHTVRHRVRAQTVGKYLRNIFA